MTRSTGTADLVHGVYLRRDDDKVHDHIQRTGRSFEPRSMAFWEASQREGRLAIDVGAYSGLYAIRAALLGFDVAAFEPDPDLIERLRENAQENGVSETLIADPGRTFLTLQAACGAAPGISNFRRGGPSLSSAGTLVRASQGDPNVIVLRLDDLFRGQRISVMKIDVEGYEVPVLAGAQRILKRDRPNLILEANTKADEDAIRYMLPDYELERVDGRNLLGEPC